MRLPRICLLLLGVASFALAQNAALPAHEVFTYSIEWRLITAGKLRLERIQARTSSQINLRMDSVGLVSKLFKVADDYSSNFNQDGCVLSTLLVSEEGSRKRETRVIFDEAKHKASYLERDRIKNVVLQNREIEIHPCVHDVAGGLYLSAHLEPGTGPQHRPWP